MRKIEKKMIAAIKAGKSMNDGNTSVHIFPDGITVSLHGNNIATLTNARSEELGCAPTVQVSLAGWETPTTRSRIHAICIAFTKSRGIGQRKGKQYLDLPDGGEMEINSREWYSLPRVNGGFRA